MSEIERYKHECIGMVHCPSSYGLERDIPIYRIDEDSNDDTEFVAKRGDLLLGGGSGESPALRISMPQAIYFLTDEVWDDWESSDEIYGAYWSLDQAFVFCEGYFKLGWRPYGADEGAYKGSYAIEIWLMEHVVAFVLQEYPEVYGYLKGTRALDLDGSICRLPSADDKHHYSYRQP